MSGEPFLLGAGTGGVASSARGEAELNMKSKFRLSLNSSRAWIVVKLEQRISIRGRLQSNASRGSRLALLIVSEGELRRPRGVEG